MTTKQADPIADLDAAVDAARARVAEVSAAALTGAKGVSAADLIAAEADLELAEATARRQRQLEVERDERASEAARVARIAELDGLISEHFGTHEAALLAKFDDAVAALVPLVQAVGEHNEAFSAITNELNRLRPLPAHLAANERQIHLAGPDVFLARIDARQLLLEAAYRAARAADATDISGALGRDAGITTDNATRSHLGVVGDFAGLSDSLRRTARLVAQR